MLKKQEISAIIVSSIIIAFVSTLIETNKLFLYSLLAIFLVITINVLAKKISGFYLESIVDIKLWEIRRWGFKPHQKFRNSFPIGAFLPIISKIFLFPINGLVWTASLVFDVRPSVHRAVKRHGVYAFSEMTESHTGIIAAWGIIANLFFAFLGYLLNFPLFTQFNLWYAFFNMIPVSNLDGSKIFFGKKILWYILSVMSLIGFLYSFIIV
ncbi:MAG TPA: hypothetical protein VJ912_04505 [Candidatus Nanoarchaeia archaeon]|nr:hypothetical protein [Candidatus Nanoarchaeia archaeon]